MATYHITKEPTITMLETYTDAVLLILLDSSTIETEYDAFHCEVCNRDIPSSDSRRIERELSSIPFWNQQERIFALECNGNLVCQDHFEELLTNKRALLEED